MLGKGPDMFIPLQAPGDLQLNPHQDISIADLDLGDRWKVISLQLQDWKKTPPEICNKSCLVPGAYHDDWHPGCGGAVLWRGVEVRLQFTCHLHLHVILHDCIILGTHKHTILKSTQKQITTVSGCVNTDCVRVPWPMDVREHLVLCIEPQRWPAASFQSAPATFHNTRLVQL